MRIDDLLASNDGELAALTGGYRLGFLVGALFAAAAALVGALLLRAKLLAHAYEESAPT